MGSCLENLDSRNNLFDRCVIGAEESWSWVGSMYSPGSPLSDFTEFEEGVSRTAHPEANPGLGPGHHLALIKELQALNILNRGMSL